MRYLVGKIVYPQVTSLFVDLKRGQRSLQAVTCGIPYRSLFERNSQIITANTLGRFDD